MTRKNTKSTGARRTRSRSSTKKRTTKPKVHRFGELTIPKDVQVKDSCYIEGGEVNESMDIWWNYED